MWNKIKKNIKVDFLVKIFLAFLFLYFITINNHPANTLDSVFRLRWYPCLDFLEQGALYGGQPYCVQGPVLYLFLYALKLLFGIENIAIVSDILNILMNALIIIFIAKIVKNETDTDYFPLILILYSALIYHRSVHISLAVLLFICSFYILYHTKIKLKAYISGSLFALSIFTHLTTVPYILIVILFYSFNIKSLDIQTLRKIVKNKALMLSSLKKTLILLSPAFALSIIFKIIFPNFYKYIFLTGAALPSSNATLLYRLAHMFSEQITLINYAPYVTLIFLFIMFMKKRDVYISTSFLGLIALFFVVNMHIILQVRFIITSLIFFVIALLALYHKETSQPYRNIFIFTTVVILITPTLIVAYYNFQRNQLRQEVEYPLNFIPEQEGGILSEYYTKFDYKRFFSNYYKYSLDKLDVITTPILSIPDYMSVEKFTGINSTLWISENTIKSAEAKNKEVIDNINGYKYELVVYGPPEWMIISSLHKKVDPEIKYCLVYVPFLYYFGQNTTEAKLDLWLGFRNYADCGTMINAMSLYYDEHFDSICKKDKETADFIKNLMHKNRIEINKYCTKGGNLAKNYKRIKNWSIVGELYTLS